MARSSIIFAIPQPGPEGNEPNEAFEEQSLRVLRYWVCGAACAYLGGGVKGRDR